jgi:phosphoserine aminotransferase
MKRKLNFYAGPSVIPVEVFETIQKELLNYQGSGLSLMETSHRSKDFDEVHNSTISLIKESMSIPDNYKVLFLGGGATMQFSMIPMNFLQEGKSCDFTLTGAWSRKAYADAVKIGKVNVIYDGADNGYKSLPDAASLTVHPEASYLHITSNETIEEAASHGMVGLKGHRSVGGCRASVYNSMTYEGVKELVDFMDDFALKNQ